MLNSRAIRWERRGFSVLTVTTKLRMEERRSFTSIAGTEGAVAGYRVIADSVASTTLGSLSGVGYMRFRAGTKATQIDYITTGGDLVVDMTGVETEGVVLQTTGGIHNFIQYVTPEGEEPEYTKTVVGNRNNAANLMLYATDNAIVAAKAGAFGLVGTGYNANDNGTTMTQGDLTATKVYGYNVGESATTVAQYIVEGGTIFVSGIKDGQYATLENNINAVIEDSNVRNLQIGRTSDATTQYTRTGNLDVNAFQILAVRGHFVRRKCGVGAHGKLARCDCLKVCSRSLCSPI